jgi:hypothetical protein
MPVLKIKGSAEFNRELQRVLPGDLTQYSLKELQTGLAQMVLKPTALPPQADGFRWAPNVELPPGIVSRGPEDIIKESDEEEEDDSDTKAISTVPTFDSELSTKARSGEEAMRLKLSKLEYDFID